MERPVENLPFWNELTEGERKAVSEDAFRKSYQKGEILNGDADRCLGMLYVLRGRIRVYILSEDGREITLFRVGAKDSCVLSASCVISQLRFETLMEAEEQTEILAVSTGTFRALAEENLQVKCFMYQLATERFSQVIWVMQDVMFLRFDRRLARFLVAEYDRTGDSEIHMTQEEIAKQVNSAREVVARMLRQFVSDGLVQVGRGRLRLSDVEGLRALL